MYLCYCVLSVVFFIYIINFNHSLSTLFAKAKLGGGVVRNFDCDVSNP